jgi:aryl-alcohol dehydrogenase-like predicted oxidoreductase
LQDIYNDTPVRSRNYGCTGRLVSEIGLGGHREGVESRDGLARRARFFVADQERAAVVGRAIDRGVTYFDTTYGCEMESLGISLRLLRADRSRLFISGMRVDYMANLKQSGRQAGEFLRAEVESRLREGRLDHLDQFILGAMEQGDPLSEPGRMADTFAEFQRLRAAGLVSHLAFSCHDHDDAARLLDRHPAEFAAVMVAYNQVNRRAEGTLAEVLRRTGAAWIAMKTHAWHIYGIPVTSVRRLPPLPGRLSHDPNAPIGRLALQAVLEHPLLSTCVPAVNSIAAVEENAAASGLALTADDRAQLAAYASAMVVEGQIPLAIAGLLEDNLRVRLHAIRILGQLAGLDSPAIDPEAADAPTQAAEMADCLLQQLGADPRWAPLIPPPEG